MFWRLISFSSVLWFLPPLLADGADQRAIFELWLNESKKSEISVLLRDGDILAPVKDLEAAGLQSFTGLRETIGRENYVSLRSLAPEVEFKVEEKDVTLRLTARPSMLGTHLVELQGNRPADITYSEDTNAFLNYSVTLTDFKQINSFSEAGLTIKNALLYGALSRNADGALVRGLSNLTFSNRENLTRFVLGDRLTSSDALGGSFLFGGISYFREFSVDPYFVRNPGLQYSGAVTTPTTVDVYVNGHLLRRVPLPPGQFDLRDLPVPAGSSDTRLVLRDAFGREQEIDSHDYFPAGLLKEGLHEFSYNIGTQRNNLALDSWHYGPVVFMARHRLGLTNSLTAGLRFEGSASGLISAGPSVSFRLPFGETNLAAAASGDDGLPGAAAFLGYSYIGRQFNFSSSVRFMSSHYATTALHASDDRSRLEINAIVGFPVNSRLGVSLRYTYESSQDYGQKHCVGVSATARLTDRISLFVSGSHSRWPGSPSNEVFTGLTFLFGHTTGNLSYEERDGKGIHTAAFQKSLPVGSGFGYRIEASMRESQSETVDSLLQYQGSYGRYEGNYSRFGGQDLTTLSMAGGVVAIGGDIFFSRPVQDSFAVIRIPDVEGVRGYASNHEVGYSDSRGNLLVPNLLPYYGNRLGISDKDIPLNYEIDRTEMVIAPPFRGGAVVLFPVHRIQRALGRVLIESSGKTAIPTFGQLTVHANGKPFESPIGRHGEFYLENLPAGRHSAIVEYERGSCEFLLDVPDSEEPILQLGEARCAVQ